MIDALKKQFLDALVGMLFLQQAKNKRNAASNELNGLNDRLDYAKNASYNDNDCCSDYAIGKAMPALFIFGVIWFIVVMAICSNFSEFYEKNAGILWGGGLCILTPIVSVLVGIIAYNRKKRARIKDLKNLVASYETDLVNNSPILEAEISRLDTVIEQLEAKCDELCAFLPQKYRTLHAIDFMFEALDNMRADTLKEVINLYESHLSDMELKQQLNRMQIASELQAQELQIMNSFMEKMENNQAEMSSDIADIKNMQYYEWIKNS